MKVQVRYPLTRSDRRVFVYRIVEGPAGRLEWRYVESLRRSRRGLPKPVRLDRCNTMCGSDLTGPEAESLTGMRMPAAMDRLRELLHDHVEVG